MKYYIFELIYNSEYIDDVIEKYVAERKNMAFLVEDIDIELRSWYTFDCNRLGNRYQYLEDVVITLGNVKEITKEEYDVLKEYNLRW